MNLPSKQNEPVEPIKHSVPGLIDLVFLLNIIYNYVVKQYHLKLVVTACQTIKVTLADGTSAMYSSYQISLEFDIAGTKHQEMFLIALIRKESVILRIPFLKHTNPDINWKSKTLVPRSLMVTDIPDNPPDSSNLPILNSEPNILLKPPTNKNVKVYLVNQIHIDPEDQVYLFHVYSNPINAGSLPNIYHDLNNIFAETSPDQFIFPPHCGELDYYIDLKPGSKPIYRSIYNLSECELSTLKKYINDNLKLDCIRPSTSPFSSSVLFTKKPDGKLCLCVNYQVLNDITVKNRYPLPLISELLDRVCNT